MRDEKTGLGQERIYTVSAKDGWLKLTDEFSDTLLRPDDIVQVDVIHHPLDVIETPKPAVTKQQLRVALTVKDGGEYTIWEWYGTLETPAADVQAAMELARDRGQELLEAISAAEGYWRGVEAFTSAMPSLAAAAFQAVLSRAFDKKVSGVPAHGDDRPDEKTG